MGKNKLKRFSENKTFENVFQPTRAEMVSGFELKGNWNKEVFQNENPIVLELGCGKGEYTVALAEKFPIKISSASISKVLDFGEAQKPQLNPA